MIDIDEVQKQVEELEQAQIKMMAAIKAYESMRNSMQEKGFRVIPLTDKSRWISPISGVTYAEKVEYVVGLTQSE